MRTLTFLASSRMPARTSRLCRACLGFPAAALLSLAAAENTSPTALDAPRPPLLVVEGTYTGEVLAVTTGGLQRGAEYRGLAEIALDANLAVLGAPADLALHLSAMSPHGGDFSGTRLGDLQGASNIAAYNHPLLFELWLGASLADRRADVRLGRLVADADFATTEGGGAFLNSSFGWPAFVSANTRHTGPAFNRSALGGFARMQLTETLLVQAGVYDGDSFDDPDGNPARHPNGLHFELGHGQGTFAIAEITLARRADASTGGRTAALKLGAWRHTADFADQFDPAQTHSGNQGFYAVAETTLWRESDPGSDEPRQVTTFGRFGVSPRRSSRLQQTADAGLNFTGLLPGRRRDVLGLGAAWARISDDARRAERAAGAPVIPGYELVIEASYQIAIGERWRFVPDLQWVRHPGASSSLRDALVLGLRTRVQF